MYRAFPEESSGKSFSRRNSIQKSNPHTLTLSSAGGSCLSKPVTEGVTSSYFRYITPIFALGICIKYPELCIKDILNGVIFVHLTGHTSRRIYTGLLLKSLT